MPHLNAGEAAHLENPNTDIVAPKLFLPGTVSFGAASCPLQAEGGNYNSDWYDWLTPAQAVRMARDAPTKDWGQGIIPNLHPEGLDPKNYLPGLAVDHWNRYEEDFSLGEEIGLQNYHSGLEWSRIETELGRPYDRLAIQHYRKILKSSRAHGMEPIIDLSHFSLPLWAQGLGGWESSKVVEAFGRFAGDMAKEFKNEVTYWATFNEPDTYSSMTSLNWPLEDNQVWLNYSRGPSHFLKVRKNMVLAHRLAYEAMKGSAPEAQVGFTVSMVHAELDRSLKLPVSYLAKTIMERATNKYFAPRMAEKADWIGMQYYWYARFNGIRPRNDLDMPRSDQGWTLYPEGHYHLLKWLSKEVAEENGIPIFITETGVADREDKHREQYIKESAKWMDKAISEGVDCRAFSVWSLTDNFEWDRGIRPRYGLIGIDYNNNLARTIRPGAKTYANIIRERTKAAEPAVK